MFDAGVPLNHALASNNVTTLAGTLTTTVGKALTRASHKIRLTSQGLGDPRPRFAATHLLHPKLRPYRSEKASTPMFPE